MRSGWSKAEKIAFSLFVVGLLSGLLVFVHPWYDLHNDASMYIVTARAMVEGHGYTYLGQPFRLRPPGFSAIIAPLISALGTNFYALNLLVSFFGAAAVVLLFLHQRTRVGWILGLLSAAALWLNPAFQRLCNQIMSDVPGLALLFFCLLTDRWASRARSWRREIILGVCIGLSTYVRAADVLLLPAIIVSRLLHQLEAGRQGEQWSSFAARRLGVFAVVACVVILPWSVRNALNPAPSPADQTLNYSISTAMWHRDPGDPNSPTYSAGEILSRLPANALPIARVFGSRMQIQGIGNLPLAAGVLYGGVTLVLLICLLVIMLQRRAPAEFYAAGMLLVAAFYFSFTTRLVLAVYALSFAAAVEVVRNLVRRASGDRTAVLVTSALVLLLIALDFKPRHDWAAIEELHQTYVGIASAVESRLEPDARLASTRGFHYSVYLDRPVYSLKHAIRRAGEVDAAEEIIDEYGINTVVLSPLDFEDRAILPYFLQHYGSGMKAGSALVWRVRPPFEQAHQRVGEVARPRWWS